MGVFPINLGVSIFVTDPSSSSSKGNWQGPNASSASKSVISASHMVYDFPPHE